MKSSVCFVFSYLQSQSVFLDLQFGEKIAKAIDAKNFLQHKQVNEKTLFMCVCVCVCVNIL